MSDRRECQNDPAGERAEVPLLPFEKEGARRHTGEPLDSGRGGEKESS